MDKNEEKDIENFAWKGDLLGTYKHPLLEWSALLDISDLTKRTSLYLEFMAAAFIKEVDIPASECELVILYGLDKISFRFKKREGN